jgi:hypothetical protein
MMMIIMVIKSRMRWVVYVALSREIKNAYKLLSEDLKGRDKKS